VWVDGQVELLVYYAQPSWPHFPFQYLSQTLELADRGSIGQMLVNPRRNLFDPAGIRSGFEKSSFISTIIPAYNPRPFGYFFIIFPGSNMSAISLIQPDRDLFPGRSTGLPVWPCAIFTDVA
jgi:hypothetical protein